MSIGESLWVLSCGVFRLSTVESLGYRLCAMSGHMECRVFGLSTAESSGYRLRSLWVIDCGVFRFWTAVSLGYRLRSLWGMSWHMECGVLGPLWSAESGGHSMPIHLEIGHMLTKSLDIYVHELGRICRRRASRCVARLLVSHMSHTHRSRDICGTTLFTYGSSHTTVYRSRDICYMWRTFTYRLFT